MQLYKKPQERRQVNKMLRRSTTKKGGWPTSEQLVYAVQRPTNFISDMLRATLVILYQNIPYIMMMITTSILYTVTV